MDKRAHIDERIKSLLTSTDLTFKQIIEQLRAENISASFNTIRRVNRNHRYRKPRYEAKLTAQQRKELVALLKNTGKPNLSSLARRFGVCHGSIWYWWDKLSKIREQNNGVIPDDEPILDICEADLVANSSSGSATNSENTNNSSHAKRVKQEPESHQANGASLSECADGDDVDVEVEVDDVDVDVDFNDDLGSYDQDVDDPLDLSEDKNTKQEDNKIFPNQEGVKSKEGDINNSNSNSKNSYSELEMVGSVQAKDIRGQFIKLPIMMYAPLSGLNEAWNLTINNDHRTTNGTQSSAYSSASSNTSTQSNVSSLNPIRSASFRGEVANCSLSSMARQLRVD